MTDTTEKTVENPTTNTNQPAQQTPQVVQFGGLELTVLNQKNEYVPTQQSQIYLPQEHEQAVAVAIKHNLPLLLEGETGTGKTSIAREIAFMRKQGYTRINMTGYTTPDELIGSKSVKNQETYYEDGVLTRAMKEGHICVVDEINATPPDCTFIMHGLLDDDKRVVLPNGDIITPHKEFRFIATMNPDYEGTRGMNRAFVDRFTLILNFKIPAPDVEAKILVTKGGVNQQLADKMVILAHKCREVYKKQETMTFISTRTLLQWADLMRKGLDPKIAYKHAVIHKARTEERAAFGDYYSAIFKEKPEEEGSALVLLEKKKVDEYERRVDEMRLTLKGRDAQIQQMKQDLTKVDDYKRRAEQAERELREGSDLVKNAERIVGILERAGQSGASIDRDTSMSAEYKVDKAQGKLSTPLNQKEMVEFLSKDSNEDDIDVPF